MAYNDFLADRIVNILKIKQIAYEEKKMFGGLCYMIDDKMCIGIVKDDLMARIGEDATQQALSKDGCKPMDFTGRPMKGYVFISPEGYDTDEHLEYWVNLCLAFNPKAKASKKKQKK